MTGLPPGRDKRRHIEGRPNRSPASPKGPFPAQRSAVAIERRHTSQNRNLLAVQHAELREVGYQGHRRHIADARHRCEQVFLLALQRALPKEVPQVSIEIVKILAEPVDMALDLFAHPRGSAAHPALLCRVHLDEMHTARRQGTEDLGVLIWQGT